MRAHEDDHSDLDPQRSPTLKAEAVERSLLLRAAAVGRADVLGSRGVLGLQRAVGNAETASLVDEKRSPIHDVVAGGGDALDADVRTEMEARLGHDFGDVRVHTDAAGHDSACAVGARAYTVGSHVVFQRDAYDPSSAEGRTTLAHELTHVVQQRSGPVDGTPAAGGIKVSDPSDRFEIQAADTATRVMAQPATAPAGAVAQRESAPEKTDAMQLLVQRETAPEEEEEVQTLVQRQGEEAEEVEEETD
jgi:hypothetical protein